MENLNDNDKKMEMLKVSLIAKDSGMRPSDILFPNRSDIFKFAVDNALYDIRITWEINNYKNVGN